MHPGANGERPSVRAAAEQSAAGTVLGALQSLPSRPMDAPAEPHGLPGAGPASGHLAVYLLQPSTSRR